MADHEEYKIRKRNLKANPFLKNFKEGFWVSPNSNKVVQVVISYEAEMVNINWNSGMGHTSIYPIVWDYLFDDWTYLGKDFKGL